MLSKVRALGRLPEWLWHKLAAAFARIVNSPAAIASRLRTRRNLFLEQLKKAFEDTLDWALAGHRGPKRSGKPVSDALLIAGWVGRRQLSSLQRSHWTATSLPGTADKFAAFTFGLLIVALIALLFASAGESVWVAGAALQTALRPVPLLTAVLLVASVVVVLGLVVWRASGSALFTLLVFAAAGLALGLTLPKGPWSIGVWFWGVLWCGGFAALGVVVWQAFGGG